MSSRRNAGGAPARANFNLLPQPDHKRPGMINLQQYYLEEFEIARAKELPNLDLRFRNKVV